MNILEFTQQANKIHKARSVSVEVLNDGAFCVASIIFDSAGKIEGTGTTEQAAIRNALDNYRRFFNN
jgi:hypothetical protein